MTSIPHQPLDSGNSRIKWYVCVLLLLALVLNYMDRMTLSLTITAIQNEIHTNNAQYGRLEKGFGYAFAVGGLIFGMSVDRLSVKWLYPIVLLGWSAAGLATGYADRLGKWVTPLLSTICDTNALALTDDPAVTESYLGFLVCRVILGFFEAGQWPCALVTTQRLLAPSDRPLGNSILQSGASIGAILTPYVVAIFDPGSILWAAVSNDPGTASVGWWRWPFVVVGVLGLFWIGPWLRMVRGLDLSRPEAPPPPPSETDANGRISQSWRDWILPARRYLALVVVVIAINMTWQYFRAWLPKMLEDYHHYKPQFLRLFFIPAYYIATDVGCLLAGAAVKRMVARGWDLHRARLVTYTVCALLTALSTVAAPLPQGPLLLCLLLVIGFGALGLFPIYYSLTQELSGRHQGKVSGSLGFITWVVTSEMQELVGKQIDATKSYAAGVFWIGLVPLAGAIALALLWGRQCRTIVPNRPGMSN